MSALRRLAMLGAFAGASLLIVGCGARYGSRTSQASSPSPTDHERDRERRSETVVTHAQPGLTIPTPVAEGKDPEDEPALPVRAKPAESAPPPGGQPDPEPLRLARQWQYDIAFERGELRVLDVKAVRFARPVVSARQMGRFAVELWIGPELIDRVRFDFPLLAAEELPKDRPGKEKHGPTLASGLSVTRRILVPASPRATRALLLDRATGKSQVLPWPPDAPLRDAHAEAP